MKNRLLSLDVLRGLTIMLMTIVNNPGSWEHVYPPLLHAEWHGCTPTDLVFPTFLFIVGITTVLSTPRRVLTSGTFQRLLTRALRIFSLGLFLNFFSKITFFGLTGLPLLGIRLALTALVVVALFGEYDKKRQLYVALGIFALMMLLAFGGFEAYSTVRIPGVLQRIALVYLLVSLLYLTTSTATQVLMGVAILLIYWALMTLVPVPGFGPANLDKGINLAAWLDNLLLPGHLWSVSKTWDPEGLLSTLPAVATGIAGLLTGTLLQSTLSKNQKTAYLLAAALGGIALGWLWGTVFPINKALWTSSYVLYAAGLALLVLGTLYWIIDLRGYTRWTLPFVIFGLNPIVVFFFSGVIPRVLGSIQVPSPAQPESVSLQSYLYDFRLVPHFSNPLQASLAWALLYLLFWFVILYVLYRRRLVFKV
ncbi:lpg1661 family Dot/Icm T4SS effector [Rhabdobacter roseus]|uniref:Putative acyltransferase n=1 Tax=Rhabdobacter roseus TaxID=1655419 RepID=A0A840TP92_9BACT|nr:DUF5009 domain-containing protein [Rhabdobacter roseus]MBB5285174.1 putative acyltransferase [Rhabdobacter roseus]